MSNQRLLAVGLLLAWACLSTVAGAESAAAPEPDEPLPSPAPAEQPADDSLFEFLNAPHHEVSTGLEWLSKRMDTFFSNERIYAESTGSYAKLSGSTIIRENGEQSFFGDLSVRVELPHTKEKLKLIIETDADENLENRPDQQSQPTPNDTLRSTSYFAGVEKAVAEDGAWQVKTSAGLKVRSPLDPFVRLRISRDIYFSYWKFRFTETLFHFHSTGTGYTTVLEWDRPMSRTDLFRIYTSATWWDNSDHYDLSQSFIFYHQLTERRALSYSIGAFGTNKPSIQADTYLFDIRYRQLLHKDWLFAEVNPQVLYEKARDFKPEHSLTLKLEMIFGEDYL
ncbi:MAG: hypothetical protein R6X06_07110 [Gammaproteobacteria bacterium]